MKRASLNLSSPVDPLKLKINPFLKNSNPVEDKESRIATITFDTTTSTNAAEKQQQEQRQRQQEEENKDERSKFEIPSLLSFTVPPATSLQDKKIMV